ncbi:MAG: hypothetical protein JRJ60_08945 [Deltaproteobacteria bacterium]|nr:hypothetical protein [Deltaproteobacteria bacterium]
MEKQTEPDGAPDLFTFTGDAAGTISDDEQIVPPGLLPGVYTTQEIVPEGWFLTRIECSDANSTGDPEAATATFNLDPGELVQCTFTNTRAASIGDTVFHDYNANGVKDSGEPGIPGVEVCLYAHEGNGLAIPLQAPAGPDRPCAGEPAGCMDTKVDGGYVFENLNPYNTYCVIIPNPPEDVYLTGGMNPRDIPPLAPGEAYDLADFPFRSTALIPAVTPWGVIILGLLLAASAIWIMKRRKRVS